MSTSTFYNFLNSTNDKATSQQDVTTVTKHGQRTITTSPDLFAASPCDSSSSLNQFNSLTPTSTAYSSSSSTTSSASSFAPPSSSPSTFLTSTNVVSTTNTAINTTRSAAQLVATTSAASRLLLAPLSLSPTTSTITTSSNTNRRHRDNGNIFSHNNRDLQRRASIMSPTMQQQNFPHLSHSYTLHSLEPRPLKPFKSQSAYIEAMKEDLSEWLNRLYSDLDLTADNFFAQLETGVIICRHANNVTQMGRNLMLEQATSSAGDCSGGSNDNSLTHENGNCIQTTSNVAPIMSSPSPECDEYQFRQLQKSNANNQHILASISFEQRDVAGQPLSRRQRHSTTNSSISSIATSSSSASRQRLSLTGSSLISPRNDRVIDWFRVKMISYKADAQPSTFFARDNICQFILWCRSLNVRECLLFETDDLVGRKNEKSFILCLLEIARIGFKVGMPTPLIIQLEQEIDREIENEAKLLQQQQQQQQQLDEISAGEEEKGLGSHVEVSFDGASPLPRLADKNNNNSNNTIVAPDNKQNNNGASGEDASKQESGDDDDDCEQDYGPKPQVITNDLLSLHERVVQLLCQCTCATQFPMVRIGDGKYRVGDKLVIFVRILRRHIMVRVGGGWQELSEFLRQKDPCRTKQHHGFLGNSGQLDSLASSSNPSNTSKTEPSTTINNLSSTKIPQLTNGSSNVSRSRHLGSNNQLSKSYHRNKNSGQKLISGSVSMSWLSHNS